MRNFCKPALAAAVAVIFSGSLASANFWNHNKSAVKTGHISISQNTKIAHGPELMAGNYKVELIKESPVPQIAFYQNGKLVVQTTAKLVTAPTRNDETKVLSDIGKDNTPVITEIDLNGWNRNVVFSGSGHQTSAGKPGV
ncbi:MAG TPA: hypothetical protein VG028_19195 [Terriglobia bacterium]|nr:hypothetical protein [Terriglobia bacterium]